jgi:phospholipid/cholesterol/gamma-HCH transport system permease protein
LETVAGQATADGSQGTTQAAPPSCSGEIGNDGRLVLSLGGDWVLGADVPPTDDALAGAERVRSVGFDSARLGRWDSILVAWLVRLVEGARERSIEVDPSGLPEGVRGLIRLAFAVGERKGARREQKKDRFLVRIGKDAIEFAAGWREALAFIGGATVALGRFVTGRARYQSSEMWQIVQDTGARAFGIVSLISFLVGMIMAFVGAVQLAQFGAGIYVANLVGLAMAREMGPMMTAIIMAGRTGAAFAAQLGTMRVNEEIDALSTMGIDPMEFLVVPRMVALMLMMPLLALYALFVGILGGLVVGVGMLDLGVTEFILQLQRSVGLDQVLIGLVKALVFGILVAIAGCMRGMQCGNSSQAVGLAATSAVVTSIVMIIVTDGLSAVLLNVLGL